MKRFAPFFEPMENGFTIGLKGKALQAQRGSEGGRFWIQKKEGKPDETCRCDPGDGSLSGGRPDSVFV